MFPLSRSELYGCFPSHPYFTPANQRPRLAHSIAALVIGLAIPLQVAWIGVLYASEILLALVAFLALVTNLGNPAFWRCPFTILLACLGVSLLAYTVADLVLHTEVENLLRGWARLIFLGSNFVALYFLCRRRPLNILVYVVASAAATLAYLMWTGRLLDDWKFGASAPVTLLVACLVPLVTRRGVLAGSLALAATGLLHFALDSREIGGNCLLAGVLLLARCASMPRLKSLSWTVMGALTLAAMGASFYANEFSEEEFAHRRHLSAAWRTAGLTTAFDGISGSPWIGNGSQANNFEFQSRFDSLFAERAGVRYYGRPTDTSTFSPHSQILQAWFEAGIAGAAFFFYLGWRLITALRQCVFHRAFDALSVAFTFCLLRATWHLLLSPFAGLARIDMALAAVIVCVIEAERRAPSRLAAWRAG